MEDRLKRRGDVSFGVGIVDAEDELPAVLARKQPIEQRRADAANVQVAGGAGSEAGADQGRVQGSGFRVQGSGRTTDERTARRELDAMGGRPNSALFAEPGGTLLYLFKQSFSAEFRACTGFSLAQRLGVV